MRRRIQNSKAPAIKTAPKTDPTTAPAIVPLLVLSEETLDGKEEAVVVVDVVESGKGTTVTSVVVNVGVEVAVSVGV